MHQMTHDLGKLYLAIKEKTTCDFSFHFNWYRCKFIDINKNDDISFLQFTRFTLKLVS